VSRLVEERVVVDAPRSAIWGLLDDPRALARVLPGAEDLVPDGQGRWRGTLASKVGFLTVRADATAEVAESHPPDDMRLEIDGRPKGLAGSFHASIPFRLEELDDRTVIDYSVDLTVTGRLAAFGAPILRDTLRKQVAQLVANLGRELGTG
jgi:2-furoyl-CoA dehydrogenase large subunit